MRNKINNRLIDIEMVKIVYIITVDVFNPLCLYDDCDSLFVNTMSMTQ